MATHSVLRFSICFAVLIFGSALAVAEEKIDTSKLPPGAKGPVDFVKHIQPIFRAKCYSCHGLEEEESGLRLDLRKRALDGGDGGAVIVPGKSDKSPLVHWIAGLKEDGLMPPEGEGTPLTTEQVSLVRAWIDGGADWPKDADGDIAGKIRGADHWSFQPIRNPQLPKGKSGSWVRNGIDAFVLRKLEAEAIKPSAEADRNTLVRRLYLDLHGLPPTPEQVHEFVNDSRSDAYERLVDRLLASPAYGERWARHWLDLARYADSDGFEKDRPRPHAWRWRDWVIKVLNQNMPFDQFTIEQVAGDLLPNATGEQRVATGFHRNTLVNTEGGTDKEEDRVKRTVDRTNTVGGIWLAMTVECSQCHSHKYDPFTQREFYGLYSFFNSMSEPDIPAPLPAQVVAYQKAKAAYDKQHAPFVEAIRQYEKNKLAAAQAAWENSRGNETTIWTTLKPEAAKSKKGATLKIQKDGSVLASGKNPDNETYTLTLKTNLPKITALRVEALPHKSFKGNGPGRSYRGNFVLSKIRMTAAPSDGSAKPAPVELINAKADFSQKDWAVAGAIDNDPESGWGIAPQMGKPHMASFETAQDVGHSGGTTLTITIEDTYTGDVHSLGHFRISVTSDTRPVRLNGPPAEVVNILRVPADQRDKKQQAALTKFFKTIDPGLAALRRAEAADAKKAPVDPGATVKAQVVTEMSQPRDTKIHIRGNFLEKGAPVQPHTPAVLHPLKIRGKRPDRLDLAHWLLDPANPLTGRVIVNRIWQQYFGRGIVPSSRDFGTQGDEPSHPELLDWLAVWFRESGWDLKQLHKLIVTSATYRQTSAARPELAQRDPYNAWLSRQNRLRVEAEIIRDLALGASGLLHEEIGGPSVRPPQPAGVSKLGYANSVKWTTSKGNDRYRRGLYTFFQRTVPYPMLATFDAPDSNLSCARRDRSNTPLQSLTIWNDPVFFECAQALGRRIVKEVPAQKDEAKTVNDRITRAFAICLARGPSNEERTVIEDLYRNQLSLSSADTKGAEAMVGSLPRPEGVSTTELASWVAVGRTLINLDEFITKE